MQPRANHHDAARSSRTTGLGSHDCTRRPATRAESSRRKYCREASSAATTRSSHRRTDPAAEHVDPSTSTSACTTNDEEEDAVEPKEPPSSHLRAVGPAATAHLSAEPPATAIAHHAANLQGRRQAPPDRIRPPRCVMAAAAPPRSADHRSGQRGGGSRPQGQGSGRGHTGTEPAGRTAAALAVARTVGHKL